MLAVPVAAYERCWFFGDSFASRSFERYFQQRKSTEYNGYVKAHFDTSGYFNNFTSDNPSILSRVVNLLPNALAVQFSGKVLPLPKIIVIVMDDDIAKCFEGFSGVSKQLSRVINYIMTEHERGIASFQDHLGVRSLKQDYPHIMWLHAPEHENFKNNHLRYKFNKCIDEVSKMHSNVTTLMFKKVWDPANGNLYLKESGRFTAEGYRAYWEAIYRTVRYFDSVILKKNEKRKNLKNTAGPEKFRWQNPQLNLSKETPKIFKKLPPPPPRH